MNASRNPLAPLGWNYDIREIPEDLFLAVLARRRADSQATAADPGDS
jgi:hypothetical protein